MKFNRGDEVVVVFARPYLGHRIGERARVVDFMDTGHDATCEVTVEWGGTGQRDCVYANQFELVGGPW